MRLLGGYPIDHFKVFLEADPDEAAHASSTAALALAGLGPPPAFLVNRESRRVSLALASYPPSWSDPIADRCGQLGLLRDTQGNIQEPVWRACGGVLGYCQDGEQKFHQWSGGYPGYTHEEAQGKLDRWKASSEGPATCAHFSELNHLICQGCSYWGKIKSPIELGRNQSDAGQVAEAQSSELPAHPRPMIAATPYLARNPAEIPRRQWLYDRHYIRKFVTATVAAGGVGKSALTIAEAIAMACGRSFLLDNTPIDRLHVWYWNGEDPRDEIERRIAAVCLCHRIDQKNLEGRLFFDSGHDMPLCFASEKGSVISFDEVALNQILTTVEKNKIDVVILDPFIAVHAVNENNNALIDQVVKRLGKIANQVNGSIEIVHHIRKPATGQYEATADDARGGGAIVNAVRSCRILNRMSKQDAEKAGIGEDDRFRFFRIDRGKQNLAPPDKAQWRHHASVVLPNGDNVQAVELWKYPDAVQGVTSADAHHIRSLVRSGEYRWDSRATNWIGRALADRLGRDVEDKADKDRIKRILAAWKKEGVVTTELRDDASRQKREFVIVGPWEDTNEISQEGN